MRRLWLHIGSHKTGTTTLQSSLRVAGRKGKLGDWTYVHAEKMPNLNNVVAIRGEGPDMRWQIKSAVLEQHIPPSGDCIISSERLFWLNTRRELMPLATTLRKSFDDIKVIVYLRRQDSFALSFRKTAITIPPARRFFGCSIGALPDYLPHMDRCFDYSTKLAAWESVFGAENIVVRRYEAQDLIGNDTVSDFSHVIGQHVPSIAKRVNKSWSRSQLLAGLWLLSKGYPTDLFLDILKDIEDSEKLLPSRDEAERFMARFGDSNSALAQKYDPKGPAGYFSDSFSQYPERGNDDISALPVDLAKIEAEVARRMAGLKAD